MDEQIFRATYDDSEIVAKLEKLEKQVKGIDTAITEAGDAATQSFNEAAEAATQYTETIDKAATQTARQAQSVEMAQKANQSWRAAIRDTIAGQQVAGKSLQEWGDMARSFADKITQGAKATGAFTGAMRIFGTVLKGLGIGLIIGAFASLINYLGKFQPLLDRVSQLTAGLGAAMNVVAERVLKLGSAVVKVFQGDFAGAAQDATAAVTGITNAIINAGTAAAGLERRLQALRDVTISQSVEAARSRVEIEKFRAVADDSTRSISERSRAAAAAAKLEEENAKKALDRALELQLVKQEEFLLDKENAEKRDSAAKATEEALERQIDLNKVIASAEKEIRDLRKEASEERKKQLEKEKRALEEFQKALDDVNKQADALDLSTTFNPIERVEKQYAAALEGARKLEAKLTELAKTPEQKQQVKVAVARLFDEIVAAYDEELSKAEIEIAELRKGNKSVELLPIPDTVTDDVKFRLRRAIVGLKYAARDAIEDQQPFDLSKFLGISDEGLDQLEEATNRILGSLEQIAEARVREAEAATRAAEEKVRAAEDALEREKELAAEGFANDVDLRRKQLAEAQKQREEAQKNEAKARRSQILLDSAQQISSLITASANIFKSLSAIPFAGVPLAIATIATMLGAFAKAKADALKAASVPKLRKGAKIEGRTHEQGGEMAVSDSGDFYELERGEWVIGTEHSREHDKFLARLNKGEFKGVPLADIVRPRAAYDNPLALAAPRIRDIEAARQKVEETAHFEALTKAYEKGADKIVKAIKGKAVAMPWKDGYKLMQEEGNVTTIKTVLPE